MSKGGDGLLQARMQLVASLWATGIKAELLPKAAPSMAEQHDHARAHGIKWLAVLDAARIEPGQKFGTYMVKVRLQIGRYRSNGGDCRISAGEAGCTGVSDGGKKNAPGVHGTWYMVALSLCTHHMDGAWGAALWPGPW